MARKDFDFGDEGMVLAEMARELDIDADELTISEEDHFGVTVYEISSGQKSGASSRATIKSASWRWRS